MSTEIDTLPEEMLSDEERDACRAAMLDNVTEKARETFHGGILLRAAALFHDPPLTDQMVAEKLGYDNSMISRAAKGTRKVSDRFKERVYDVFRVPVEAWDRENGRGVVMLPVDSHGRRNEVEESRHQQEREPTCHLGAARIQPSAQQPRPVEH